ncbi:ATP-binding protein [Mitsuokella jalaludinii]|uniref:ATP-binding protein n=1 Tax=Mitsuokella jalaludinii TaxID=187979 RepID=UPI003076D624
MSEYPNLHKLLICRSLLDDTAIQSLMAVLDGDKRQTGPCAAKIIETAEDVGLHANPLRSSTLYPHLHDPNLAAQTIEMHDSPVGTSLKQAFLHDLTLLLPFLTEPASLYLDLTLLDAYKPTVPLHTEASTALEELLKNARTAENFAEALLLYYQSFGYGDIASFKAFRWDAKLQRLIGIRHFEAMQMEDIIGYAHQKEQLIDNTEAFVQRKPANNVLLVGARGTGKSSAVKALANVYYSRGLRILQLTKPQLSHLPDIMDALRYFASKRFIIFLDDLSFEESDAEYKYLKSAIEGGVESRPENVLIYATSNRRHLIRESWRDRSESQDDVYRDDSMNETISLSDRFGLIIQYYAPDQKEYLAIIDHMLRKEGIKLTPEELRIAGVRWEMTHSGRSGRTAQQFVAHYLGQLDDHDA